MRLQTFWHIITKPIIGLAPMDGVTDPAFRQVMDEIGHPSVLYTEFVSAEGLTRNPKTLLRTFRHHKTNTPLIGQLFGADPVAMKEAVTILLERTDISGVDINMGCPQRDVMRTGAGAALIENPKKALQLIDAVKKAIQKVKRPIGISVKTRVGIDKNISLRWTKTLLDLRLDAICMHGRTAMQAFAGPVDWKNLQEAATLTRTTSTVFLGNGDICSLSDAHEKSTTYTPDGVLIGRGALGNPWVYLHTVPSRKDRISAAIQHIKCFMNLTPDANPLSLRKHIAWYVKGIPDAASVRMRIMTHTTTKQMLDFLTSLSYSG